MHPVKGDGKGVSLSVTWCDPPPVFIFLCDPGRCPSLHAHLSSSSRDLTSAPSGSSIVTVDESALTLTSTLDIDATTDVNPPSDVTTVPPAPHCPDLRHHLLYAVTPLSPIPNPTAPPLQSKKNGLPRCTNGERGRVSYGKNTRGSRIVMIEEQMHPAPPRRQPLYLSRAWVHCTSMV
jgi:hypothetical protein